MLNQFRVIFKNRTFIMFYTVLLLCLIGYMENRGFTIINIFRKDNNIGTIYLCLKLIFTYIILSIGFFILVLCYKGAISNLLLKDYINKQIIKDKIIKCLWIILFYIPISFILECLYYQANHTFPKLIAVIIINLLIIFKYLIIFLFSYAIIIYNPKYGIIKVKEVLLSKLTMVVGAIVIFITTLGVIIISHILNNYFGISESLNFLNILQLYKYNSWLSYICIIYQAVISFLLFIIYSLACYSNAK